VLDVTEKRNTRDAISKSRRFPDWSIHFTGVDDDRQVQSSPLANLFASMVTESPRTRGSIRGSWRLTRQPIYLSITWNVPRCDTAPTNFLTEIETSPAFSRIFERASPRAISRADVSIFFLFSGIRDLMPRWLAGPVINVKSVSLINESRVA